MGKTNAKMCSHKATQVLPLSKGTSTVGIASSSYFAACARHVGALALFGLMFCPVQVMASRAPRLAMADSSSVVSPVLPDQGTTTPTDSIGNSGAGDTDQVLPDTIPFAQLWKHNRYIVYGGTEGTVEQKSWEIIARRETKLSFSYGTADDQWNFYTQIFIDDERVRELNGGTYNNTFSVTLTPGRHILTFKNECYGEVDSTTYAFISDIATEDAQTNATAFVNALEGYPPLKQELQTALDNYNAAPDDEALYNTLAATLNDVRKAVSYYPLIQKDIVVADSILNEGAYVDISEAVALGRAIDVNTSTSADYLAAFDALETSIAVQVSSNQKIDDWAFNTNQRYTIDNMGYYLDQDHKVAACTGLEVQDADVTDLVIPSTVRYNGVTYAVVALYDNRYNQNKVRTLTLPRTLRHINDWGLSDYRAITDLEIPANVERMGENIVYNCPQLQRIKVNAEVPPTLGSLDNNSYHEDGYRTYHYIRIVIPRESFHAYRLVNAWNTDYNVLIGGDEGITVNTGKIAAGDLGHVVVEEAGYLQEVNKLIIEGELNADDWSKIKQMTNLTELDLSKALIDEIPSNAFSGRWAIDKVVLPPTLKKIGSFAFQGTALTSVNIPDNVETIKECAFSQVRQLQEVHLPDSLTSLGNYAFAECRSLRTVKIPTKLKTIPDYTFQNCRSLQSVELHDSITAFEDYSFNNCDLREITLPKSTTWVGGSAFKGNANLSKVTLNEGLVDIWTYAFQNTAIDTLNCPSTLRNIYSNAFRDCTNLRQINLNEGLTRIELYALANNKATEIVLPSSLEYCSQSAFDDCDSLVTIEARSVMPPNTDGGCPLTSSDLTKAVLYVPVWSLAEYQLATGWNQFYTFRTSDFMPQYVKVNKDFYFTLRDELAPDYRPDIELTVTNNQITDSQNNSDYQHGNLTISGRSKLAVNDFSMVLAPYAKYAYEGGGYNYYNDYRYLRPTSLIVKGEMRAENVTINLWNATERWQFVSFPFDVKVSDIVPVDSTTSWVIRGHSGAERAAGNAAAVWQNLSADDVLQAGKGYIMQCYKPDDKNGNYDAAQFTVRPLTTTVNRQQIFNADNRTVALEEHLAEFEHNRSWNLIGNPYPSYFDTRFLDFGAPFMVWNSNNQNYEAYSPVDDSYILAPAEAFFVQRPVDQESITFLKDGRQTDRYARTLVEEEPASAPQRIRAAYDSNTHTAAQRTVFNITLAKDGQQADRTRVVINEAATMQYDLSRDAAKFTGTEPAVSQIFTINGATRYAINERPLNNGQALLGLHFGTDGTYTIGLSNQPDGQVTLEDRLTGTKLQLNGTAGYSFTAKAGDSTDRFVLHFDAVATGINAATANEADRNDDTYTLDGRKVNNPTAPGLYIKGGKKVIK
ncbi:leucine-rich repeat domain-containing protein [Prevotellamassilia timonensis]|mgnify:CR=1 FL=1|uniref:leucine-rich repeat domain-containing protein n=1 Tax=Prevotellamassilia timonensis TaxID=1852370 RepID=UPI0040261127